MNKNNYSIRTVAVLFMIIAGSMFSPSAQAQTAVRPTGSGTSADPFQIDSLANLLWVSQDSSSWSDRLEQTADIDADSTKNWNSGAGFTPIGRATGTINSFTGYYDGEGHSITGLFISQSSGNDLGLFGIISGAVIKNLGLVNVNITGGYHTGGLVASSTTSTIDDCYTTGVVQGNGDNVGGLVGASYGGVLSNSHSTATVSGGNYVGGLVGTNYSSETGSGGNYGTVSSITNCYATGNVTGSGNYVGGLTGIDQYYTQMEKCYSSGNVSGAQEVGGLVGENIGVNSGLTSTIDSSYSTGSVSGTAGVGGLTGQNEQAAVITNSHSSGNVKCTGDYSGGFAGSNNDGSSISNCYSTCIDSGVDYSGGFSGACSNGAAITGCYSAGVVVGGSDVGGLAGELSDSAGESHIYNSYSADSVVATGSYVGGLVGYVYECTVNDCYSYGKVSGGSSPIGGLVGYGGNITNSFWDTQTSDQASSAGGYSENTSAMNTESTFTSRGWDFTSTWAIDPGINNGYPGLLWQSQYVASAPADTTYAGTNISWGSATLNGTVMPHKSTTTVKFLYGTVSGTYSDTAVASQSPLNGWDGSSVSANASELNSSTTYHYRVIASNSNGITEGNELSFTTLAFVAVQPSGSGTSSSDPYHVDSLQNLYWITQNSNSWDSYFVQDADIDASTSIYWNSGAGFSPIGNSSTNFTGTYNGKAHTITGLFVSASGSSEIGMFGDVANDTLENINLVRENATGGGEVGGLVGLSVTSLIDSCFTSGSVTGGSGGYAGGLVGFDDSSSVIGCSSADTVNDATGQDVGGLAGVSELGSTFTNCYATGNVTAYSIAGGLVGYNTPRSAIGECYATGNVTVNASGEGAGGLVGYNYQDCPINKSYSTGTVIGGGYDTGGLIGYNYSNCSITNCYSTGSANGSWEVGGLIGYNYSSVSYCYSTGAVTGTNYVGGLIGFNTSSTVTGSLWDIQTSNQPSSAAGTGDSTSAMKVEATFTNAGWDFTSTWAINIGTNGGYPYLINVTDHSLPVQAMDFIAIADVGSVTIRWETQSELANAGFNVLREEPDPSSFKLISSYTSNDGLRGLGTSSSGRSYGFTDDKVISGYTYTYKIQSVSTNGTTKDLSTLSVTVGVPKTYALYQNYPNPFNPSTTIRFDLKQASTVTLDIYNVLGQRVMEQNYGTMNAGRYNENINMDKFASGAYFYRIAAAGNDGQRFVSIKKFVLMK